MSLSRASPRRYDPHLAVDLVVRVARALHTHGATSQSLEHALGQLALKLGLAGQFFSTPTSIMMSFEVDDAVDTRLERLEPGSLNLERLGALEEVIGRTFEPASLADLNARLDAIEAREPRFGSFAVTGAVLCVTTAAGALLGGSALDAMVAGGLGLAVHLLAQLASRADESNRLGELLGAALAGVVAGAVATRSDQITPALVMMAALIPMIPGLNLTIAIKEIATKHLVSGAARFAGTFVVFLTLGAGVTAGKAIAAWLFGAGLAAAPLALPVWALAPALITSAIGFGVLFGAAPRDFVWVLVGVGVALAGIHWVIPIVGREVGTAITSFGVGMAGNLFARVAKRPSSVLQVPGIILLVPGVIGFQSVAAFSREETLAGVQTAFSMLTVGTALALGLLLATTLLPSRRSF